jgi:serine/threonine protein kinase
VTTELQNSFQNRVIAETYRITQQIGAGGMGTIFEAEHVRMGRLFALKLLDPAFAENEEVFQRFKREAEIAGQLGHPNIVDVVDFDRTEEGVPYIVMEKLEGEDLADWIANRGAFTFQTAYPVIAEIVDAMEAAHAAGIVHRDMKPQNIFLCKRGRRSDYVKLLDFGISKMKQSGSIVTRTNAVMGTPYYMSPEQAEGKNQEVDTRTDIFALGAIIYEMLTGRLAFYAPSVPTAMFKVCYEEPEPITDLVPGLPEGLPEVIAKALSKDKNERYASARALGDDLERIYEGQQATFSAGVAHKVLTDPSANPYTQPGTLTGSASQVLDASTMPPPARSNTVGIIVAIVGIIAIVGAGVFGYMVLNKSQRSEKGNQSARAAAPMTDGTTAPPPMVPLSKEITLTFYITPASAQLFVGGKEHTADKTKTKRVVKIKRGEDPIQVKVTAKGYTPQEVTVIPVQDKTMQASLFKAGQAPPPEAMQGIQITSTPSTSRRRRRRRRRSTSSGSSMTMKTSPRVSPRRVMARGMRGGGAAADDI